MGSLGKAKAEIEKMHKPKKKNVERLEEYIQRLKERGELRENDV